MNSQDASLPSSRARSGIQEYLNSLDSGFRRNDVPAASLTSFGLFMSGILQELFLFSVLSTEKRNSASLCVLCPSAPLRVVSLSNDASAVIHHLFSILTFAMSLSISAFLALALSW